MIETTESNVMDFIAYRNSAMREKPLPEINVSSILNQYIWEINSVLQRGIITHRFDGSYDGV